MLTTLVGKNRRTALAVSSLLLLAACGGGGGSGPAAVAGNPPPASPGSPQEPAQPEPQPIPAPPEVVLAATFTDLVSGTSSTQPGWAAWDAPAGRDAVGGVGCTVTGTYHQHSLVSIYNDGVRKGPPDNVGHGVCSYELHVHDTTGMVHIHTDSARTFTLAQFFALWNQPLAASGTAGLPGPIRFYVIENEKLTLYTGDPAQLELIPHREIVIISGKAPSVLPKYRWPSTL